MNVSFDQALTAHHLTLSRRSPEILQLNVGKLCNLTCSHCHVNAGPARKEIIESQTVDRILTWLESTDIPVVDLTGGSPEMIPDFRRIIEKVRQFKTPRRVIDRLNATIIEEPGYEWVPGFLAKHEVEIIASMPCYQPDNVEAQRGEGVFDASINAFKKLNKLGYGTQPGLLLNFVYNPNGAFLPPDQKQLEADYRKAMKEHFGISFNSLYCIANMPIARFTSYLKRENRLADYLLLLRNAFNPKTIDNLMCRDTINVNWLGEVFDCDFNQMLKLPTQESGRHFKVWDINPKTFSKLPIQTGSHCFGCTAGSGSSCGGSLT